MSMIKNSLLFLSVLQMSHTCGIHRYTYNKCAGYITLRSKLIVGFQILLTKTKLKINYQTKNIH